MKTKRMTIKERIAAYEKALRESKAELTQRDFKIQLVTMLLSPDVRVLGVDSATDFDSFANEESGFMEHFPTGLQTFTLKLERRKKP